MINIIKLFLISFLLNACFVEVAPEPIPIPPTKPTPYTSFCGDGWCDYWYGESDFWCSDCWETWHSPTEEWCGDDICGWYENEYNCWYDCQPIPFNQNIDPNDPGFIDPLPER